MAGSIPECDWKYMQKIKDDLLAVLCKQINKQSLDILNEYISSEYEKYLKHYEHIKNSDRIVAECFNDWRRSNLILKLIAIEHHELMTGGQLEQLSNETQQKLKAFN